MTEDIKTMLDVLSSLKLEAEALQIGMQSQIDGVLTEDIKSQIAAIRSAFADSISATQSRINVMELDLKTAVLKHGETISGKYYQAVWSKGRASWDTKKLDGYAEAHPEIKKFKEEGEPYVSIKKITRKEEK